MKCKLYTCIDHDVMYPVGGASVVIAENIDRAYDLLNEALEREGLNGDDKDPYCLMEVPDCKIKTKTPRAVILNNGNY